MSTNAILAGIERYLTAQREYEHGRADADAAARAHALQQARDHLTAQTTAASSNPSKTWRLLVAIDAPDHPAIRAAADLAQFLGSPIALVSVIEPSRRAQRTAARIDEQDPPKVRRDQAVLMLEKARAQIPASLSTEWILREGSAARQILSVAKEWAADLIIIGTRNRPPAAQFFLGSTSSAVQRRAACPVLLVHGSPLPAAKPIATVQKMSEPTAPPRKRPALVFQSA